MRSHIHMRSTIRYAYAERSGRTRDLHEKRLSYAIRIELFELHSDELTVILITHKYLSFIEYYVPKSQICSVSIK